MRTPNSNTHGSSFTSSLRKCASYDAQVEDDGSHLQNVTYFVISSVGLMFIRCFICVLLKFLFRASSSSYVEAFPWSHVMNNSNSGNYVMQELEHIAHRRGKRYDHFFIKIFLKFGDSRTTHLT